MKNKRMLRAILIGTILPIFFGYLVKIIFYEYITITQLYTYPKMLSPFIQWGLIANLLLFYIYMTKNKQEEQKGIVLPSLIYAFLAILFKFFF